MDAALDALLTVDLWFVGFCLICLCILFWFFNNKD